KGNKKVQRSCEAVVGIESSWQRARRPQLETGRLSLFHEDVIFKIGFLVVNQYQELHDPMSYQLRDWLLGFSYEIPSLAYGVKVFFGLFQFYFFFINRGERELLRGGVTHSFCPDQTLPKAESCGAVKGSCWGSRLSWSPPTCGRGGELILRCQGARRRPQVEATDALVIPVDSLLPVRACCHAGKSGAFEQSKNETDQMIVLEWLFLTIAPCDAAEPWKLGSQDAATPMMQGIIDLHHDIFFFLILILVFVSRILVRALWHFQKDKNPIPQRIVHGTTIEILRTIFPSIIPMFIAIPSFALLYSMDEVVVNPAITIKAIGHQWYRSATLHEGDLSATKCLKNMVREASGLPVLLRLEILIAILEQSFDLFHSLTALLPQKNGETCSCSSNSGRLISPVGPTKKDMGISGVRFFFFSYLRYFELDEQIAPKSSRVILYTIPPDAPQLQASSPNGPC
nr:cytochrome c oxidase subunit 2, mitochondrial [Tanacetum cinerariifolium]